MKHYLSKRSLLANFLVLFFSLTIFISANFAQTNSRTEINIPNIPGYLTLKCDFHTHTVFSDGAVWPPVRIDEAWREGLDAIAITDHIEYHPFKDDIPQTNLNRSFEIARARAEELGIILIKGAEITRKMPPGHFNALFLNDINPLDTEDWHDAFKAAKDQGAFVFWNHPGWRQVDEIPIWYEEHTELLNGKFFQGIEIVNYHSYYPKAFQWGLDKKLTLFGNSDIHAPIHHEFDLENGSHRPVTLVFASEKSEQAIKQALLAGRTAVYNNDIVMGNENYLRAIFEGTVEILNPNITVRGNGRASFQIKNSSGLTFTLAPENELEQISAPGEMVLYPGKIMAFQLRGKSETLSGKKKLAVPVIVKNLLVAPEQGLVEKLNFEVTFIPEQ